MYGVTDIGSNTIYLMIDRTEGRALRPVFSTKCAADRAGCVTAKGKRNWEGAAPANPVPAQIRQPLLHRGRRLFAGP